MSLLKQASLVLTPTAYKANKLYSVVPSNGNGDMVTTRATTATRVNSSGLVENVATGIPRLDYTESVPSILLEPQRTNLKLQSSDFTTSWAINNGATVTSNTIISPDGTQNADTINPSGLNGSGIYQNSTLVSSSTYTFSVYVKNISNATSILIGADNNPTGGSVIFNSTTGAIITNGIGIISSSVLNVGNGWYRVIGTYIATTTTSPFVIYSVAPATIGTFAIWGTQLELGSYATSYIPTTTSTVTRNQDLASVSSVSSLIGQTEGVLFLESAALSNDLTRRVLSISDGTANNRIFIRYEVTSNTISAFGVVGGVSFANQIIYTLSDETQYAKIALRYRVNDITLWINGAKRGIDTTSQILPSSLSRFAFDRGDSIDIFYGKVKSAQLYNTYLTDAEMASLTTL